MLNINLITILEIFQKQPFDIIAMILREILGLCCVHFAQLITHPAAYTLPYTLHFSSDDVLPNFIKFKYQVIIYHKNFVTSTLLDIGP